jgi:hypothetical protein
MFLRWGQRWLAAGDLPGLRINMIQHGKISASAGPLGPGSTSFTAVQN